MHPRLEPAYVSQLIQCLPLTISRLTIGRRTVGPGCRPCGVGRATLDTLDRLHRRRRNLGRPALGATFLFGLWSEFN